MDKIFWTPAPPNLNVSGRVLPKVMLGAWFLSSIGANALQVTLTPDRRGLNISSIYGTNWVCGILHRRSCTAAFPQEALEKSEGGLEIQGERRDSANAQSLAHLVTTHHMPTFVCFAGLHYGFSGRHPGKPSPFAGRPFAGALLQCDPKTYWLLAPPEWWSPRAFPPMTAIMAPYQAIPLPCSHGAPGSTSSSSSSSMAPNTPIVEVASMYVCIYIYIHIQFSTYI